MIDSVRRTGILVTHNVVLRLRDPAQLISYIAMPMVLMLVFKPLYVRAVPGGELNAVVGPLVLFSVFALAIVGHSIMVEREWRTWDRLRVSRATRTELLLGKTLPILITLLLQQAVLLTFGLLVVGLPIPRTFGWLVLAVLVWGFTLLAIGCALATVVRSRAELSVASDLGAMLVGAIGGALIPVAIMPGWAQAIAPASPGYWAISLLRGALDGDPSAMVRPMLILLAIAAVATAVAIYRLARGWGRSRLL